ncbi:hypothetical protein AOLI_G00056940 [Acnodon oligacanthus]
MELNGAPFLALAGSLAKAYLEPTKQVTADQHMATTPLPKLNMASSSIKIIQIHYIFTSSLFLFTNEAPVIGNERKGFFHSVVLTLN